MNAFTTGLLAGYGIAIPVGAIAILIVTKAARESFRSAAVAGLGAASADLTVCRNRSWGRRRAHALPPWREHPHSSPERMRAGRSGRLRHPPGCSLPRHSEHGSSWRAAGNVHAISRADADQPPDRRLLRLAGTHEQNNHAARQRDETTLTHVSSPAHPSVEVLAPRSCGAARRRRPRVVVHETRPPGHRKST